MKIYSDIRQKILSVCDQVEVHHIGSTAIPGLKTKGDLDLNVRVQENDFWDVIHKIKKMGYYELEGTLQNETLRHLKPHVKTDVDVAIQVTVMGSEDDTFVLFNEILLANKNAFDEYSAIKKLYGTVSDQEYRERKAEVIHYYINAVKNISQQGEATKRL